MYVLMKKNTLLERFFGIKEKFLILISNQPQRCEYSGNWENHNLNDEWDNELDTRNG